LSEKYRKVTILIAPPPPIFERIAKITPSISQHIDPLEPSGLTGYILPKEISLLGGVGSLINHSERRIPFCDIKKNIELCRKYRLVSFVCAKDVEEVESIARLNPDFIALEPPELIGGEISVSNAKPGIIKQAIESVKRISPKTIVLCGAGIKNREDVKKAIQLGAGGVLVASGVVKTENIEGTIEELIKGML
jgi:triosephosphate isomerase